jgi:hypothetical protein
MSLAAPIDEMDAGDRPRPDVPEHGLVAVHNYGFGHSAATCTCGWTGRLRYLKAAAELDAWVHRLSPLGDSGLRRLSQPARISCSIGGSMLPPDRITTVRPGGVAPFR